MSKKIVIIVLKCNKSLFCYATLTILTFPVVCDIDFIVITGNILRSVNDIPIVKTGISLYHVIPKIVIPMFCPIHFTIPGLL